MTEYALRIQELSKTFPGGRALHSVSFDVERGSVHALLGGNGSGKSTLVKSLAGVQSADGGGLVRVGDHEVATDAITPSWARKSGLRFVHQNPGIFPQMTVADNMRMGAGFPTRLGRVQKRRLEGQAAEHLAEFGIDVEPSAVMGELRVADQTMVAIARALQRDSDDESISTLILDEPTASLPEEEVAILLSAIKRTAASGVAIIYISHRLEEIMAIADAMTVLRDGREVVTRSARDVTERDLVSYIVGSPLEQVYPPAINSGEPESKVALELKNVSTGPLKEINLQVRTGEIVGIAGLLGSGRTELLQTIFGHRHLDEGQIEIDGSAVSITSERIAMQHGIAYIPEDRDVDASLPNLTVRQNISLASLNEFSKFGRILHRDEGAHARDLMRDFRIKAESDTALMSSLSGGNRQKVVLARWMRRNPRIVLLDEPTQGVDVGARADAYQIVRAAVAEGMSAILVSSDFEELADMSDRVVVLYDGRIVSEVTGRSLTRHRLTELVFAAGRH